MFQRVIAAIADFWAYNSVYIILPGAVILWGVAAYFIFYDMI